MFNVGDRIETLDGKFTGELVHLEDGIAYIELNSGVEMEFGESDLQAEGTVAKQTKEEDKARKNKRLGRIESDEYYDEVFAALPDVIKTIGSRTFSSLNGVIAKLCDKTSESYEESLWGNANSWQKLNIISVTLGTTTEKLVSIYKNKKSFSELELLVYAAIGNTVRKDA